MPTILIKNSAAFAVVFVNEKALEWSPKRHDRVWASKAQN